MTQHLYNGVLFSKIMLFSEKAKSCFSLIWNTYYLKIFLGSFHLQSYKRWQLPREWREKERHSFNVCLGGELIQQAEEEGAAFSGIRAPSLL